MPKELDLESLIGKDVGDLLVRGLQALHRERVAAWNAHSSYAFSTGQTPLNETAFGIREVEQTLRRVGAGPSSL